MAFLKLAISLIVLGILYGRMIRRETPDRIAKTQAAVPVLLGAVSVFLSFACFMAIITGMGALGFATSGFPALPRSLCVAFLAAGLPEEAAKLLMMLLTLRIFRSRVRNIYEYILIGAAVGFGFTLFEEFLYGSGSIVDMVGRIITLAGHMAFGMIMAKHLGLARHNKVANRGSVAGEYAKAILIPMLVHTLFDALTANNFLLASENDMEAVVGIVLSIAAMVALFVLQIRVLVEFKKNTDRYCKMMIAWPNDRQRV